MMDLKKASLHLSKILDNLGYNREIIQYRIAAYREMGKLRTNIQDIPAIIAGSKGEGLTKPCENDLDTLCLIKHVICFELEFPIERGLIPNEITAFKMASASPGYMLLRLEKLGSFLLDVIFASLVPNLPTNEYFLSSYKFSKHIHDNPPIEMIMGDEKTNSSGVAFAFANIATGRKRDIVLSIPCMVPSILQQWLNRERLHQWPPVDLRYKISQMNANLVPTGFKGSQYEQFEWRICFNEIELLLTQSLNQTQHKLYVLLKMVKKDILKPREKEISSYILKNIVWWLAEKNPARKFKEQYLLQWLFKALQLLMEYLEANNFPYYMIPGRNLLAENMNEPMRVRMLRKIKAFLIGVPLSLLNLKPLIRVSYMSNSELCKFSSKRDDLEMLGLSLDNRGVTLSNQGSSLLEILNDQAFVALFTWFIQLLMSSWPPHLQRKFKDFINRLIIILK